MRKNIVTITQLFSCKKCKNKGYFMLINLQKFFSRSYRIALSSKCDKGGQIASKNELNVHISANTKRCCIFKHENNRESNTLFRFK